MCVHEYFCHTVVLLRALSLLKITACMRDCSNIGVIELELREGNDIVAAQCYVANYLVVNFWGRDCVNHVSHCI